MPVRQITIVGTGLIGGSFGLAIKKHGFRGRVVGCDREPVLQRAREMRAIDAGDADAMKACAGSDVVLLATPVGTIIDLIERLGPVIPPDTLLTDIGSTKAEIVARVKAVFGRDAAQRFLPGHPMAGKEHGGIENATPDLFAEATWAITPVSDNGEQTATAAEFLRLVESTGAHVMRMTADRHDQACAWISHLPQLVSTALASLLEHELAGDPQALELGGPTLRDMTRVAASSYSMWRDIVFTNSGNIQQALLRLEQRLAHLRENLKTRELESEFDAANQFRARKKNW